MANGGSPTPRKKSRTRSGSGDFRSRQREPVHPRPLEDRQRDAEIEERLDALERIQPDGRIVVGDLPQEVVNLIPSGQNTTVAAFYKSRNHYRKTHPETQDRAMEREVLRVIAEPDRAMVDLKYGKRTVNVFRALENEDVMVSIEIIGEGGKPNRIKSARAQPKERSDELWNEEGRAGKTWEK